MTRTLDPWRSAALGGVLYLLAYWIWLLPALVPGPIAPDLGSAYRVLIWIQALALITLAPAVGIGRRCGPGPNLLLAMAAWPLLAVFFRLGGLDLMRLAEGQALVLTLALLLWGLGRAARFAPHYWRPTLVALIQAVGVLGLIVLRP